MIDTALKFLVTELNEFINIKLGGNDPETVELISIVDDKGECQISKDSVGCTLVNIEEERIGRAQSPYAESTNGTIARRNPEVKLNLYILFAANPDCDGNKNNYAQGLRLLSYIISFFQGKNHFNNQNSPALDTEIEKLIVDLYSIPMEQQNYLWGALGAKYVPSVVYRVRLLTIQEGVALDSGEAITIIDEEVSPSSN